MSELTDYEWAQRALNALYLELPAQVASDCIPKLKRIIELYRDDIARLSAELEEAKAESSEYEKALDAVWVNDGKWRYETHQGGYQPSHSVPKPPTPPITKPFNSD